jgi:hypothetical protein
MQKEQKESQKGCMMSKFWCNAGRGKNIIFEGMGWGYVVGLIHGGNI